MPPLAYSRHYFTRGVQDASGRLYLTDREPYTFRTLVDSSYHTVVVGDTLHGLADYFYRSVAIENPADLFWVIADFQPERIWDVTLTLTAGRLLVIPSVRELTEEIFSESRRP
jgi:hypothetical protein